MEKRFEDMKDGEIGYADRTGFGYSNNFRVVYHNASKILAIPSATHTVQVKKSNNVIFTKNILIKLKDIHKHGDCGNVAVSYVCLYVISHDD